MLMLRLTALDQQNSGQKGLDFAVCDVICSLTHQIKSRNFKRAQPSKENQTIFTIFALIRRLQVLNQCKNGKNSRLSHQDLKPVFEGGRQERLGLVFVNRQFFAICAFFQQLATLFQRRNIKKVELRQLSTVF